MTRKFFTRPYGWQLVLPALIVAWLMPFPGHAAAQRLRVCASILPQQYFLERIGGAHLDISILVAPGADPHTYEPRPRQMAAVAGARLYFAIGVPFERAWLPKLTATNPQLEIVATDHGIAKLAMTDDHAHAEQDAAHEADAVDPHIWLAPALVKIQADNILKALLPADPAHAADYRENFQSFIGQLDMLEADLRGLLAPFAGQRFMVFHPSWGYFAQAFELVQIPIEVEGKEPKPAQLQRLIEQAHAIGIRAILVQPQFSSRSAGVIAEAIAGRVVVADPMAADWAANLRAIAGQLQEILK